MEGQLLQIITVEGKQVSDFVAFAHDDLAERYSSAITRGKNNSIMLQQGMSLYSNRRTALFELVEDTVGRHDLLYPACDPRRYEDDYQVKDHANCREALVAALSEYAIDYEDVPDPVNWFMNVSILQKGELEIRESLAEPNDYVILRAAKDSVVGITACPQDKNDTNSGNPTDILVRIFR
jgi:uncharacterized protein YcgI (DUF1989 family)